MLVTWAMVVAAASAVCAASPWSSRPLTLEDQNGGDTGRHSLPNLDVFHELFMALSDMQDAYFQRWLGTWPEGIDWTRAVMNTHVVSALRTISDELELARLHESVGCATRKEEVVAGYFADVIAYYFGEDAFSIRNQAYDDMLWVVLEWLESIQFIDEHGRFLSNMASAGMGTKPEVETWYGSRWMPAFAHRARVFWELAAKGWDTKLCEGGMIWNPRLMPYKNAITNQLFISASIGMYRHFPGDDNSSPFGTGSDSKANHSHHTIDWRPHDPVFGKAAQDAHAWLASSNMTNAQGLYADGFHISGHSSGSNNTKCDERDEMVYTYNQGVLLSGLLGLYQATGREEYLREGHTLIQNVIRATGYGLAKNVPIDDIGGSLRPRNQLPPWRGLGRVGVLEEACDAFGTCSQDAQTFKGIWMHHFAAFCSPAALGVSVRPDAATQDESNRDAAQKVGSWHAAECKRYIPWLRHNARAAMGTRDGKGLFGMWWTAGLLERLSGEVEFTQENVLRPSAPAARGEEVVDYRNLGVPQNVVWVRLADLPRPAPGAATRSGQKPMGGASEERNASTLGRRGVDSAGPSVWDPNLRGRGRTVETQGGGLALLRALWVVSGHEL